jgi:hypothetical protein
MKKTTMILLALASVTILASCDKNKNEEVDGWKPVYSTETNTQDVTFKNSEPLEKPGRIYTYDNLLLVNDEAKGIHIYDNSNVTNPTELSFIAIPGNMDFSVSNGRLYADNITDMVVINISNPSAPEYVNRIEFIFPVQQFPDEFGSFECVDPAKGTVVGWEKTKLINPECFR